MKMHCGKIISVAISFLKNASLPGLYQITYDWMVTALIFCPTLHCLNDRTSLQSYYNTLTPFTPNILYFQKI